MPWMGFRNSCVDSAPSWPCGLGQVSPLLCEPQLLQRAEPSARKAQLSILCSAIQGPHNAGGAPIVSGTRCRAPEQISKLGQNRDVHRRALGRGCGSKEGPPHPLPVSDTEVRLPTGASFPSPPSPGVWHLTSSHFFFTHTHIEGPSFCLQGATCHLLLWCPGRGWGTTEFKPRLDACPQGPSFKRVIDARMRGCWCCERPQR